MVATLQVFGADWNVSMVNIQLQKLLWVYCPGHAGMKGNDQADTGSYGTLTSGLLLTRSEMLRSLRHYLRAQSQGHHTIDRLEERGVDMQTFFLERTRKGHGQSGEHWNLFKGDTRETSERRDGAHMGFSERIDTILN